MSAKTQDLTWATVDLDDPAQMREPEAKLFQRREEKLSDETLRRVRTLGIIGDCGNRLSKTLPPDMREGGSVPRRLNGRAPNVYRCQAPGSVFVAGLFHGTDYFNGDDRAARISACYLGIPKSVRTLVNQEFEQVRPPSHLERLSFPPETKLRGKITFEQAAGRRLCGSLSGALARSSAECR